MQTITKTFNIYEFDELSKEIQQALIEKEAERIRESEIESFLKEEMEFYAQQLLTENFGEKAIFRGVHYVLNYCQGDGAMIEFDLVYYGKSLSIKHDNYCHYYHEKSFEVIENDKELTELQYNTLKEKIISINKKLADYGYQFIEEDRTAPAIEELKNCMFYENGDIY